MKPPRNLWPYGIILAFVLFISGTVSLVVMACSQRVDLVNNNYYEQELQYQAQIDRATRANGLASQARIDYDGARKSIVVSLPRDQAGHKVVGQIQLYRPSAAGMDRQFDLQPDARGTQSLDASRLSPGLWWVRLSWVVEQQEYFVDQKLVIRSHAR
jgi:hypothetical protein